MGPIIGKPSNSRDEHVKRLGFGESGPKEGPNLQLPIAALLDSTAVTQRLSSFFCSCYLPLGHHRSARNSRLYTPPSPCAAPAFLHKPCVGSDCCDFKDARAAAGIDSVNITPGLVEDEGVQNSQNVGKGDTHHRRPTFSPGGSSERRLPNGYSGSSLIGPTGPDKTYGIGAGVKDPSLGRGHRSHQLVEHSQTILKPSLTFFTSAPHRHTDRDTQGKPLLLPLTLPTCEPGWHGHPQDLLDSSALAVLVALTPLVPNPHFSGVRGQRYQCTLCYRPHIASQGHGSQRRAPTLNLQP